MTYYPNPDVVARVGPYRPCGAPKAGGIDGRSTPADCPSRSGPDGDAVAGASVTRAWRDRSQREVAVAWLQRITAGRPAGAGRTPVMNLPGS